MNDKSLTIIQSQDVVGDVVGDVVRDVTRTAPFRPIRLAAGHLQSVDVVEP